MNSGSYRLYIKVSRKTAIVIGALGRQVFEKGIYVYTGSAMKNLKQRMERHKTKEKKIRWHIDYLLDSRYSSIVGIEVFESQNREECRLNMEIAAKPDARIPVMGFGSSDCKSCPAHLIKIE